MSSTSEVAAEQGAEQFFGDVELLKKILKITGIELATNFTRDGVAGLFEHCVTKHFEKAASSDNPELTAAQDANVMFNDAANSLNNFFTRGFIDEGTRDELVKGLEGLKDHATWQEGAVGAGVLDFLKNINNEKFQEVLKMPFELAKETVENIAEFNRVLCKECATETDRNKAQSAFSRAIKSLNIEKEKETLLANNLTHNMDKHLGRRLTDRNFENIDKAAAKLTQGVANIVHTSKHKRTVKLPSQDAR